MPTTRLPNVAPLCARVGGRVGREGERLGTRALVPAEGVEVFCFQALIDFSEPLYASCVVFPNELGIVVIYIITAGNKMTPR